MAWCHQATSFWSDIFILRTLQHHENIMTSTFHITLVRGIQSLVDSPNKGSVLQDFDVLFVAKTIEQRVELSVFWDVTMLCDATVMTNLDEYLFPQTGRAGDVFGILCGDVSEELVSEDGFHVVSHGLLLFDATVVLNWQYHRVTANMEEMTYQLPSSKYMYNLLHTHSDVI